MCKGCERRGCTRRGCTQGLYAQGLCTRVAHARVVGTLSQSDYTGIVHKDCTCKGGVDTHPIRLHRGCTQGWWGHSANQITQGLCTMVPHTRVERTLSQSDYMGVACKGCMQGLRTQGLHARVVCAGVVHAGLRMQGLRTRVAHAGIVHAVGPSLFVLGYRWLPLATIDLVGDNREFEV